MDKNRKKFIIFGFLVFILLFILIVRFVLRSDIDEKNADKYISVICEDDYIDEDGELTCKLKGNGINYSVCGISSTILKSDDYELLEVVPDSFWEGDGDNGDIDLYSENDKKDDFNIVTFKLKLLNNNKDEIKINIVNNIYVDQNIEEHKIDDLEKNIKVRR